MAKYIAPFIKNFWFLFIFIFFLFVLKCSVFPNSIFASNLIYWRFFVLFNRARCITPCIGNLFISSRVQNRIYSDYILDILHIFVIFDLHYLSFTY